MGLQISQILTTVCVPLLQITSCDRRTSHVMRKIMKSCPMSGPAECILTPWICWGRGLGASGLLRSDSTFLTPLPRPVLLLWNEDSQQVLLHFLSGPDEALQDGSVSLAVPYRNQLASFAVSDAKFQPPQRCRNAVTRRWVSFLWLLITELTLPNRNWNRQFRRQHTEGYAVGCV